MKANKFLPFIFLLLSIAITSCDKEESSEPLPIGYIEYNGEKVTVRYPFFEKIFSESASVIPMKGIDPWTGREAVPNSFYIGISSVENDFVLTNDRSCLYLRLDSFDNQEFNVTDESVIFFCFKGKYYTTVSIYWRSIVDRWRRPSDYKLTDLIPQKITGGKVKAQWREESCLLEIDLTLSEGQSVKISGEISRDYINRKLDI